MENVEQALQTALSEIEKLVSTKTVVGEPITINGTTIIPLISIGFAFGAGGGTGKGKKVAGEGAGLGIGGVGGIKPLAIIIVNQDGVRIEPLKRGTVSVFDRVGDVVEKIVDRRQANSSDSEDE